MLWSGLDSFFGGRQCICKALGTRSWERRSRERVPFFEERGRNAFLSLETGTRQERVPDIKGTRSFLAPRSFFEQILTMKIYTI